MRPVVGTSASDLLDLIIYLEERIGVLELSTEDMSGDWDERMADMGKLEAYREVANKLVALRQTQEGQ